MKKSSILALLTILVSFTFVLKIVSYHIDAHIGPISLFSVEAWVALLFIVILALKHKVLYSPIILWTLVYGLIVMLMTLNGHLVYSSTEWFKAQVIPFLLANALYVLYSNDIPRRTYGRVTLFVIGLIFVSLVFNINGLSRYPGAVRYITGGGISDYVYSVYRKAGIEGYGFFSGMPPLIPPLVYLYKRSQSRSIRIFALIVIAVLFVAVVLSSITTPLILASIALILSVIGSSIFRKGYSIIIMVILFLAVLIFSPEQMGSTLVRGLIVISPSEEVDLRLADIDKVISGEFEVTETSEKVTSVEARFQRVYWNLSIFSKHFIIGSSRDNEKGAFHLFWLYMLASIGLLGAVPFFIAFYMIIADTFKSVGSEFRYYYTLSILLFILMGAVKNIVGWFMYFVPIFIVPGVYWLASDCYSKVMMTDLTDKLSQNQSQ